MLQAVREQVQLLGALFEGTAESPAKRVVDDCEAGTQDLAFGRGQFGGCCWCGGTAIRREIGNGEVGFVADAGDDGGAACADGASQRFVSKCMTGSSFGHLSSA